ncbi:MAG: ATP-binding protein, partial [Anaerolineae bacterium]|nr:ATP-binding protein [Anaerolineae bacterium]
RIPAGVGLVGEAAVGMKPVIVNNVEQSDQWSADQDEKTGFVTRGLLVVPMIFKEQVIGVIEVINKKDGMPFNEDDQELLTAFAGQAAVAVENVRLYTQTDQQLSSRVEELSVMQRIDRELNTSLDVSRAMLITLEWAKRQTDTTAALIGIVEGNELRIMASEGYLNELDAFEDDIMPLTLPTLLQAVAAGRLQRLERIEDLSGGFLLEGAHSQIVIPLQRESDVIGLLLLESIQPGLYDEEKQSFLLRLSDHASIAISNAQLYNEVQRANIAKSDFVSFVSHELKTPMTSIKGYADLLSAGAVGEVSQAQSDFLATIRTNIDRMSTLVSDLADVSRIEAGRLHLEFSGVEVREVVDLVLRTTESMIKEKNHNIELLIPEELPAIWCDQNRLVQVMTNLISNAYKYTLEGGTITIQAVHSQNIWDPEGSPMVIHLSVKDSGIGIKEEDQKKIFTQYFRTDEGKDTAPGTGLGLNITRYLVEMQGGKIWFESKLGRGTTFHFTIPVAESRAS